MAYKKSYNRPAAIRSTTTTYRPRRTRKVLKKTNKMIMTKPLGEKTEYNFKRTCLYGVIGASTSGPTFGSFAFRLSDLPDNTEFKLFDQYKITGVKLLFVPSVTNNGVANADFGNFLYYIDYDDNVAPVNIDQVYQKQSLKIRQPWGRPFKIFLRPRPALVAGIESVSGNQKATLPTSMWMDTLVPDALYHGIQWAWTIATVNTPEMSIYATYYFKCRGVQ